MYKPAITAAIIFALIGVIVGAMGAHALRPVLTEELMVSYETAVKYQFYHSFALALAGIVYQAFPTAWIRRAVWAFFIGILLFCGSIYLLVYMKATASLGLVGLGLLTPMGGLFFVLGWLLLLIGINVKKK